MPFPLLHIRYGWQPTGVLRVGQALADAPSDGLGSSESRPLCERKPNESSSERDKSDPENHRREGDTFASRDEQECGREEHKDRKEVGMASGTCSISCSNAVAMLIRSSSYDDNTILADTR